MKESSGSPIWFLNLNLQMPVIKYNQIYQMVKVGEDIPDFALAFSLILQWASALTRRNNLLCFLLKGR